VLSWLKRCKGQVSLRLNEFILMSEENLKAELTFPPELVEQVADRVVAQLKPILTGHGDRSDDEIFDVKSLASYLKVSKKWIYERTHLKEIPYIKVGGQLRFRKRVIDKWLDAYNVPVVSIPTNGVMRLIK